MDEEFPLGDLYIFFFFFCCFIFIFSSLTIYFHLFICVVFRGPFLIEFISDERCNGVKKRKKITYEQEKKMKMGKNIFQDECVDNFILKLRIQNVMLFGTCISFCLKQNTTKKSLKIYLLFSSFFVIHFIQELIYTQCEL